MKRGRTEPRDYLHEHHHVTTVETMDTDEGDLAGVGYDTRGTHVSTSDKIATATRRCIPRNDVGWNGVSCVPVGRYVVVASFRCLLIIVSVTRRGHNEPIACVADTKYDLRVGTCDGGR